MHQDREIRQKSYLVTKYEKARQDAGLFYILSFLLQMPLYLPHSIKSLNQSKFINNF